MKGDRWVCRKCGDVLLEADVPYVEAVCRRTLECRRGGGVSMKKEPANDHRTDASSNSNP
jgi:phage FluMu protein Com